jgi:hypothetical protein
MTMKTKYLSTAMFSVAVLVMLTGCWNQTVNKVEKSLKPVKVELKKESGRYLLYADGKPFYIKGAGLEFGNIESLARHGGNAFRTWRVDNGELSGKEVLDLAHKHGLMVCMGIEVGRERHGFDYDDETAVRKQLEQIEKDVIALKDHPALLMWGIGNELNLRYTNPKVWDAVNEIADMIHEVDPNHPTTTMLAGAGKEEIQIILERCPELDLLCFQLYGVIDKLPLFLEESGYKGAYIVSEWGATGHWEVPRTSWNRPIEQNSHEKANAYLERYQNVIAADKEQCIGSFVFLWGQKQERTPTWYGLFLENGDRTESVDYMHYAWNGEWPENRVPKMESLVLDGRTAYENVKLKGGESYTARVRAKDGDNDPLTYRWEILREVERDKQSDGGDFEPRPESILEEFGDENEFTFNAPGPGEYRLFVYASDGNGSAATANIPFKVD